MSSGSAAVTTNLDDGESLSRQTMDIQTPPNVNPFSLQTPSNTATATLV